MTCKNRRWEHTSIGTSGFPLADALAPAVEAWLVEYAGEHNPEDLAEVAREVVRAVADERGLYRAYNRRGK